MRDYGESMNMTYHLTVKLIYDHWECFSINSNLLIIITFYNWYGWRNRTSCAQKVLNYLKTWQRSLRYCVEGILCFNRLLILNLKLLLLSRRSLMLFIMWLTPNELLEKWCFFKSWTDTKILFGYLIYWSLRIIRIFI